MGDWPEVPLETVLADGGVSYGIVQPGSHVASGVPIVRVTDLEGNRIRESIPLRVPPEIESSYSRTRLCGGEVLVSIVGTVGRVAIVPKGLAGWNVARAVAVLKPLTASDNSWLRYALLNDDAQEQMGIRKTDTAQATLNLRDLRLLTLPWPEDDERRRIAGVLGALDDLIEIDQQHASAMDELWHAVVEDSVGQGEAVRLSSLASFSNGKNFTGNATGSGRPVVRTPEVRNGPDTSTVRSAVAAEDENVVRAGDVLFVWSGSLLVGRWCWEPGLINQHIFKVVPSREVPIWLAYWAVEQLMTEFLGVAADKATTMGHIKRADLDRRVTVPPRADWAALDPVVSPLWDEAIGARMEANDLAKTRDELLPLLMSGRVRARPETVSPPCQTSSITDHQGEP